MAAGSQRQSTKGMVHLNLLLLDREVLSEKNVSFDARRNNRGQSTVHDQWLEVFHLWLLYVNRRRENSKPAHQRRARKEKSKTKPQQFDVDSEIKGHLVPKNSNMILPSIKVNALL